MNKAALNILLIEDNPADIRLTREAIQEVCTHCHLQVALDGQTAMDMLFGRGEFTDFSEPSLILLDLNIPGMDGRSILAEIKGSESLRRIPVVVLTTSNSREDIDRCYDLQANCFITKPVDLEDFLELLMMIKRFWLDTVQLPKG